MRNNTRGKGLFGTTCRQTETLQVACLLAVPQNATKDKIILKKKKKEPKIIKWKTATYLCSVLFPLFRKVLDDFLLQV